MLVFRHYLIHGLTLLHQEADSSHYTTPACTVPKLLLSVSRNPRGIQEPISNRTVAELSIQPDNNKPFLSCNIRFVRSRAICCDITLFLLAVTDVSESLSPSSDWSTTSVFTSLYGIISHKT
jgi:hypothetical protein